MNAIPSVLPTINWAPPNDDGGGTPPPADPPATPPDGGTPPPADPPAQPPVGGTPPADPPATPPASPWGDEIDDELKTFIGDKTPAQIAKELKGAQALIGKKTVGIPGKDAKPEEWKAYHEARGVPASADGYDFTGVRDELLADIPEAERDQHWDAAEEKRFKELAKAANLSSTEASELIKRELGHRMEANKEARAEALTANKKAADLITENWGPRKDEFTQDANNFARHMGLGDDVLKAMTQLAGVNADARFKLVDFMRQQGALLREGGQPGTTRGAVPASGMTPAQATQAKRDYLAQSDNQTAYMDPNHPNHKAVTDQVTQYLRAERGLK